MTVIHAVYSTCTCIQQDCVVCHVGCDKMDRRSPGGIGARDDGTSLSCNESEHISDLQTIHYMFHWNLVGSLTSIFSTNMAIFETKGQGWRTIPTH